MMKKNILIVSALAQYMLLGFSFTAAAQTPTPAPDIRFIRTAGVYSVGCGLSEVDPSVVSACWVRSDLDPVTELGCTSTPDVAGDYHADVTVFQTTFDDAEIRCYLVDDGQLVSEYSDNKGDIDFTPPARGRVIP